MSNWVLEYTLTDATDHVESVAFSQNNNWLASTGLDGNVYIYDMRDNFNLETTLTAATGQVNAVAFSQDNNWIAYGDSDDKVYVHDINDSWNLEITLTDATNVILYGLAFSQDNNWLAYGSQDNKVYIHDINNNWSLETTLTNAVDNVESLAFSQDNNWLAYGDADGKVYVHDINDNWSLEITLSESAAAIYGTAFSQDNNWLAYGSMDNNVYVYDINDSWALETTLDEADTNVYFVAFSQNNNWISYCCSSGDVYIHNIEGSWSLDTILTEAVSSSYSVAFSQDNNWIVYGGFNDEVYVHSFPPVDIDYNADMIVQQQDIGVTYNSDTSIQDTMNESYEGDVNIPGDVPYTADTLVDALIKFQKLFNTDGVYSLAINKELGKIIATNYTSPNDTLSLEIGDVFIGGQNSGLWIGQDEDNWYATEPINIIASAPYFFSNIIRGQVITLPATANKTINRVDIYLTEFDISGTAEIEYNLYLELYYADDNNRPIGRIGQDYLAQDIISYTDERLQNKDDFYSFDFGESGFVGTSNNFAVIYRVETVDNKQGFLWWETSNYKQNSETLQPYLDGVSILSKDGGEIWEVQEDYDRTIKVYYPKPSDYEVSSVTFDELFSETVANPTTALIILVDESGSIITSN